MTGLFSDESILIIEQRKHPNRRMYFDGAVNVHENGIRAILMSPSGAHFPVGFKLRFPCTNNIAEHEACIVGLETALYMNVKHLQVYGESILIISKSTGECGVKSPELTKYKGYLTKFTEAFRSIHLTICRSKNYFADALATLSSMIKI